MHEWKVGGWKDDYKSTMIPDWEISIFQNSNTENLKITINLILQLPFFQIKANQIISQNTIIKLQRKCESNASQ
jgi:hypothetical protein